MCFFRKISFYFDKVTREIRMIHIKRTLILSVISLFLGIVSWIIGGGVNRVVLLYIFPRSAINIGFMFIFWGISFIFIGTILSGVLFGCEKYRRYRGYKIALYIIFMQIFTLAIYPLFFGAISPFITLLAIIISVFFCFLAIITSFKIYSLWTVCLCLHILWLIYNAFICLAFIFIN